MQTIQTATRIHPLVAGAAASVILVSLVGVAAITGLLPSSRGEAAQVAAAAPVKQAAQASPAREQEEVKATPRHVVHKQVHTQPVATQQAAAPRAAEPQPQSYAQQPAYPQPQAQAQPRVSPVGIAAGAVLGGVLGNQVGGGNGRTLATVAGAVGGGYLGNEVGKRYGY